MSEGASTETVPEAHLSQSTPACPVCERNAARRLIDTLQTDPLVELSECAHCRAISATRLPDEIFLKALYSPDQYTSDLFSDDRSVQRCGRHIAAIIPRPPTDKPLRVLDYGGGDGSLSRAFRDALRANGHHAEIELTVVDYFVDERREKDIRFLDVSQFAELTERFDIVIASAVLEHLVNLTWTSRKLLECCDEGGIFYARTPYESPLAAIVPGYRVRWPRHLHDLGPAFWSHFLSTLGREGEMLRSTPSIVETDLRSRPLRTVAAYLLKAPAHLEARIRRRSVSKDGQLFWKWVGGWEVVLRIGAQD